MVTLARHINLSRELIGSVERMKHSTSRLFFGGYGVALRALRVRSVRRGIWHRALNRLERAQVDLTLRVVRKVQSPVLARVLDAILEKLRSALESRVLRMIGSVGFPMARRLSELARSWGNLSASTWSRDRGFARFLAVTALNDPDSILGYRLQV